MPQVTISARIDSEDKMAFNSFCNKVGLSTSSVLNLFIKKVIAEERIPFEISLSKPVTLEQGSKAFYQLREEAIGNGLQGMTLNDINEEIYAARKGK